jgi:hypothetical protein
MASGFIILTDGRCFARQADVYDYIIQLVIEELSDNENAKEFKQWLETLISSKEDIDMGWGSIKHDTGENIMRWLDLRELTETNQKLFWTSLQHSLNKLIATLSTENKDKTAHIELLKILLKMHRLAYIRDDPNNLSHWQNGYTEPPSNNKIGPGWEK